MALKSIFYLNEQGNRQNMEDSIFPTPGKASENDCLFLVCDGVGGQSKGEEASRIVCESIAAFLLPLPKEKAGKETINMAVKHAEAEMRRYVDGHPEAYNMSTTLTLALVRNDGVWVSWCGDSRIYHVRNGNIHWQSKDHSLVQHLLEQGEITEEEAKNHPQKNIILRSLGISNQQTKADTYFIADIMPDDYLLLCTDGLLERIDKQELMEILGPQQRETDKQKLFMDFCKDKTSDNFSMYLLQFGDVLSTNNRFYKLKHFLFIACILVILIVIYNYLQS